MRGSVSDAYMTRQETPTYFIPDKPNVVGAATTRSLSKPKKSTDAPATERIGSSDGEVDGEHKKAQKSRSTSRGILNRFKSNKEESEQKAAEKKVENEETKAENEEAKATEETPVLASTEAAPIVAGNTAAEVPAAADVVAEEKTAETPLEEKVRANKRGSIFGRVSSGWSGLRSPAKEKDIKDAELKPETVNAVSSEPPVLPETAAATESTAVIAVPAVEEPVAEPKAEEQKEEAATPSKEKNNFLSGIGGFIKRNRSVSPNTHKQDPVKAEETSTVPASEPAAIAEPVVKAEEPATEVAATAAEPSTETAVEEPKTETTTPNKRQSVLGSLGRRASKALNRMQAPKKENAAPVAETKADEATTVKPAEETPLVNGKEEPQSIGDVVPEAVNVGQPQHTTATVTASA